MNKKFWATTFTLTGTIIGAGILGLPYIFAKSGFLVGLLWLILIGAVMMFVNLCLGEVTLRTKGHHQLSGYAKKYLGKWGQRIMFFAILFGIYSALLAYLIGEGQSLSKLLPGNINPFFLGISFWILMTLLLREGLKGLKKIETWGVTAVIIIIIGILIKFSSQIQISNLTTWNQINVSLPIGIVIFALMGFTSIPELREEIRGKEKLLKKAIIIGSLIPIILYILFSATVIGVLGKNITQVATLSFGPIMTLLGIFTMLTSYFVLSFSLRDTFKFDIKVSKKTAFLLVSLVPIFFYALDEKLNLLNFSTVLGIGGIVSGTITGILIIIMNKRAKNTTRSNKEPEIQMPINWPIIILLSIIFITGLILEIIR
jgi:tyrosine-specific transport protein